MNLKSFVLVSAASLLASNVALAQEAESDAWMQPQGSTAPAATVAAKPVMQMSADRARVRAEAAAALRSGELAIINAEAYSFERDRNVDAGTRMARNK